MTRPYVKVIDPEWDAARRRTKLAVYWALTAVFVVFTVLDLFSDVLLRTHQHTVAVTWDWTAGIPGVFWMWMSWKLWTGKA